MIVVALVLAPVLMLLVSVLERRLGPSAAGWGAALPITLIVSVAAVTARSGMDVGSKVGLSAAAHVPAQVLFAIAFAHLLWHRGLIVGITAGVTVYCAGAVVISLVPPLVAAGLGVVAVAAGPRLMPQVPIRPGPKRSWLITAASCVIASLVVAAVLVVTRISGPGMAGMIAAYPSMCTLLTITLVRLSGRDAGVHVLSGLVRSLPTYLTFGLVVGAVEPISNHAALPVALLVSLTTVFVTWRLVPTTIRPLAAE